MSVEKVSFKGVGANAIHPHKQSQQASFTGAENPVDEQKSKAAKYMIGATVLAGIAALGIAGYKGHLGEGIQKLLGGAEKAAKKGGAEASESVSHTSSASRGASSLEDDLALNRGVGALDEEPFVTRGIYGQDINDPLDPMNAYDMLSPYYQAPMGTNNIGGYGSFGTGYGV